ncbi:MAG: tetratricopeptide repeat protein [Flectobacillus sp.]
MTVIFILSSIMNGLAQDFDFNTNLQNAYNEITKLRLTHAKQLSGKESPNNGYKIWVDCLVDAVNVYASENEAEYEKLVDKVDDALDVIDDLDTKAPQQRQLRAELKFYLALVQMKLGHETKAGMSVMSAYKLLEENKKLFPNYTANYKILGVIHVLIGSVPENYRWITKMLGLKGNIDQGIRELEIASQDKITGFEAKFFKLFIQSYILPINDKVRTEVNDFVQKHTDSELALFLGVAISEKDNKSDQAWKILQKVQNGNGYLPLPIFDFYTAEIYLQKGNYTKAESCYQAYLKKFKGHSFIKDSYYKLFIINYLNNESQQANSFLQNINQYGKKLSESDKAAQKFYDNYTNTKQLPNKNLLQARLAIDGGYYKEALENIKDINENTLSSNLDKAEFNFRKGRIYQNLGDTDLAIQVFEKSITLAQNLDTHFGASSSLQLGYIYQRKKEVKKALTWFEKALSYKKHEYKNSVDNKAQAAITEINH